jgi:hypothetical protein
MRVPWLFLADDLANRVLGVSDRALHPAFHLFRLAFGFGCPIAQRSAGSFLNRAGGFLQATCNAVLVHDEHSGVSVHAEQETAPQVPQDPFRGSSPDRVYRNTVSGVTEVQLPHGTTPFASGIVAFG